MFGISLKTEKWKRRIFMWLGVIALLCAFPPFLFYPLAWLAPFFLFLCISHTSLKRSFRYGYFFGFLFNFFSLYWIHYVTGGGWIFAAFFQALYMGVFAVGTRFLLEPLFTNEKLRMRIVFMVGVSNLWLVLEWIRVNLPGFGFGWDLLSYSQAPFLPFIQLAEWIGAYGLSFLIVFGASLVFLLVWDLTRKVSHRWFHAIFYSALLLVVILGPVSIGLLKLKEETPSKQPIRIGVIQGNIPQELKWESEVKEKIIEKHVKLSQLLMYDRPDMVLWPEASYPGFLLQDLETSGVKTLIQNSKVPYLIGSIRYENDLLYNSAIWLNAKGEVAGIYDKHNLVPFGEYVPLKFLFFFLERLASSMGVGDFNPGKEWTIFKAPFDYRFAALVCFENVFPSVTSEFVKQGAEFFVVITNDAWFKRSRAPYEHINTSVFRAIETRRPFIHAANTGVSGFIDEKGRLTDTLQDKTGRELFVMGGMTRPVTPQKLVAFYVTWGWTIPLTAFFLALFSFGIVSFSKGDRG
jgi:apolipoprotein N-acyltransferase